MSDKNDDIKPYVQEINSHVKNSLETPVRYWGFILLTALVLLSYHLVGIVAIFMESGSFDIPRLIYIKGGRGADYPSTFSIFMFTFWQYVVVHEIAHKDDILGKFGFVMFTFISLGIGLSLFIAMPETLIPTELTTESGEKFFKNGIRLVLLLYFILCSAIIFTFLSTEQRLIVSPYDKDSYFSKNMYLYPLWFPFVFIVILYILLVTLHIFRGTLPTTSYDENSYSQISPSTTIKMAVEEKVEAVFQRYQQANLIDTTIFVEGSTVVYMGITMEGASSHWRNAIPNIVSELREITPSARIVLYDADIVVIYSD